MKLELLMLTTVISMITERQTEAQLKCFKNRDQTGKSVAYTKSHPNLVSQFRNGPKVCQVPANSAYIFFNLKNFEGKPNAAHSLNDENYYPGSDYKIESVLVLGSKSKSIAIHLFDRVYFQGGSSKKFIKKVDNVMDGFTIKSAVVMGNQAWTIESECNNPPSGQSTCSNCLQPSNSGASFITSIEISGLGKTLAVKPGVCLGTKHAGKPKIPDCLCNQHGVVDGPDKCNGVNGVCKCQANHTGHDCGQCSSNLTLRDGKCVEGCGCNPKGVFPPGDLSCEANGDCFCHPFFYDVPKCDDCAWWAYWKNGACQRCGCFRKNTPLNERACNELDGKCRCRPHYIGKCTDCGKGYLKYSDKCLNQKQLDKVKELEVFRDNQETNVSQFISLLDDLENLGVVDNLHDTRREVKDGWKTAYYAAQLILANTDPWIV